MMMNLCSDVLRILHGKTLVTAESCTGGGIGAALTAVSGSSAVYKGGIISYCNEMKEAMLGVPHDLLQKHGAVSASVAEAMASGARSRMYADVAVSVTGLAGPGGDEYGNPVGTVFIGYCDNYKCMSREFHFLGDRDTVRLEAISAVLHMILEQNAL